MVNIHHGVTSSLNIHESGAILTSSRKIHYSSILFIHTICELHYFKRFGMFINELANLKNETYPFPEKQRYLCNLHLGIGIGIGVGIGKHQQWSYVRYMSLLSALNIFSYAKQVLQLFKYTNKNVS